MTALTIRNFDANLKRKLKIRAAEHDRSMEAEATAILEKELAKPLPSKDLATAIREDMKAYGIDSIEFELPPRSSKRPQVKFDE